MKKFRLDYILDVFALVFAGTQPEDLIKYIQLALGILATLVSIAFSIWQWWKRASKDGKITEEEFKEGADIIRDGTNEIKHHLEDKNKSKGE